MKIINIDNLKNFAYTNLGLLKDEPKGIVLDFFGFGVQNKIEGYLKESYDFAEKKLFTYHTLL